MPNFDPRSPLPRRAVLEMRATAVGQASPSRLRAACAMGLALAAGLVLFSKVWWVSVWPLLMASFAAWGLAAHGTLLLDVDEIEAPRLRLFYRLVRGVALVVGGACALIGLAMLLAAGMGRTALAY